MSTISDLDLYDPGRCVGFVRKYHIANLALVSPKRLVLLSTQVVRADDTYSMYIEHDTACKLLLFIIISTYKYLVRTWGYIHKQQYNTRKTELLLYNELCIPDDCVIK